MESSGVVSGTSRFGDLLVAAHARPHLPVDPASPRIIVIDAVGERLGLMENGRVCGVYPVSTALAGIGGDEGSFRTPPGWHRIHRKIGAGALYGTVYVSREPTGRVWAGEPSEDDLILTRILTLEGLEESINRGPGCDSLARYIYIHGTNHELDLGRPASHGCVRMGNADIVELFDRVAEGDPVVIVESPSHVRA